MKSTFHSWLKLVGLIVILLFYFIQLVVITAFSKKSGIPVRTRFCSAACRWLNMPIRIKGTPYSKACLYVSNHRSMLDPLIELSILDCYILSKAEVAGYPLIGPGAKKSGVLFVERENHDSRKSALIEIEKTLLKGNQVLIYPEGTTQAGELTSDFRRGSFEVAARNGIPVVPVMIDYPYPSYYWTQGSILEYYHRIFNKKGSHPVRLSLGKEIVSDDAFILMRESKDAIDRMIVEMS